LLEATKKLSALLEEKGISADELAADFQDAKRQSSDT